MSQTKTVIPLQSWAVLALVTLVVTVNYLDRFVLSILIEPIKATLRLSDTQIGVLTGAGFALLYSTLAIPVARLAERYNRVVILTLAVLIWSAATALCGATTTFAALLLARVLVGCGESGAIAPSLSMLADIFPAERRGIAMAVFGMGGAVGSAVAPLIGGLMEAALGWRMTFVALGAMGLPLALLLMICVREPARGAADGIARHLRPLPLGETLRRLFGRRTFVLIIPALILMALAEYSMFLWMPSVFQRSFGVSSATLGAQLALYQGMPFFAGTWFGGAAADRLSRLDRRWIVWLPMIGALLSAPAAFALFNAGSLELAYLLLTIPSFVNGLYVAPSYALIQNLSAAHSRATANAVLTFAVNLIGAGLGPLLIGAISEGLTTRLGAESLRHAFYVLVPMYLVAAAIFLAASRSLRADLADVKRDGEADPASLPV